WHADVSPSALPCHGAGAGAPPTDFRACARRALHTPPANDHWKKLVGRGGLEPPAFPRLRRRRSFSELPAHGAGTAARPADLQAFARYALHTLPAYCSLDGLRMFRSPELNLLEGLPRLPRD